jgi:hypothetical protein
MRNPGWKVALYDQDPRHLSVCSPFYQCCGSGIFYPGSEHFLIPDPNIFSSPIPDPTWKVECKLVFFLLLMLSGLEQSLSLIDSLGHGQKDPGSAIRDVLSRIPDPTIFLSRIQTFFFIPDPTWKVECKLNFFASYAFRSKVLVLMIVKKMRDRGSAIRKKFIPDPDTGSRV